MAWANMAWGTLCCDNLWTPKAFLVHHDSVASAQSPPVPEKPHPNFCLGVPPGANSKLVFWGFQCWPLGCVILSLGNNPWEEDGSAHHQAFYGAESGRPQESGHLRLGFGSVVVIISQGISLILHELQTYL